MKRATVFLVLAALLLLASVALAQRGDGASSVLSTAYDLSWWTVDGGGYTFTTGGDYSLGGTIGQPDAGGELSGGGYTLSGGFWGGAPAEYSIYLPLVLKNYS